MADEGTSEAPSPSEYKPKQLVYCGICSLPPEYCEFGGTVTKCEEWLKTNHPEFHEKLYSEDALNTNLSSLSVSAQQRAEKDASRKAAKAAAAAEKESARLASSKVLIKRVERNKRKYVTVISGLDAFGYDLKKVAKDFGKKFASGSSVTKTADGREEVTVQGDVCDDVEEMVEDVYGEVPEGNVEVVLDGGKKK